jgi:hypothetical protein
MVIGLLWHRKPEEIVKAVGISGSVGNMVETMPATSRAWFLGDAITRIHGGINQ